MKIIDIVKALDLKVFSGESGLENEITGGYVSDLLSDVVGNAGQGDLWVTLQTHKNVLAVASLKELAGVLIVKGQLPDNETCEKSNEEKIPLLGTEKDTFQITGQLYEILMNS